MANEILLSTLVNGVTQITLNRPEKRNALDGVTIKAFADALTQLKTDAQTRVVVIANNGEHFCAGGDLAWMQKMATSSHEENVADALSLAMLLKALYTFPKPTIALVQGAAMGGGLGILASCDMVIAANNTQFCFSEAKIGLTPSVISPYVIAAIGERAARYYFLTAELFFAEQACAMGLIQKIVSAENLSAEGLALAQTLLKNSPLSLIEVKNLVRKVSHAQISDELSQLTAEHLAKMRASSDAKEGLKAFLEKRAVKWE